MQLCAHTHCVRARYCSGLCWMIPFFVEQRNIKEEKGGDPLRDLVRFGARPIAFHSPSPHHSTALLLALPTSRTALSNAHQPAPRSPSMRVGKVLASVGLLGEVGVMPIDSFSSLVGLRCDGGKSCAPQCLLAPSRAGRRYVSCMRKRWTFATQDVFTGRSACLR